ncbi:MAG TPA: ribonuclease J, partial [Acidimicrobiales bacterium]|nr:ribonuclease J [Acidimicrobiales bacterium]
EVIHTGIAPVHVSGHAMKEELKTLLSVARPEYFVAVHGEYRHLVHHCQLAASMGVPEKNCLLAEDGDVLELTGAGLNFAGEVPAGYLYVDGIVGDVGHGVLRDRRALSAEGVVVVVVTVDSRTGEVLTGPEIVTRGWVYEREAEALLDEACQAVLDALEREAGHGVTDIEALKRHVRSTLGRFVSERTRRRPMIVPVVMEV